MAEIQYNRNNIADDSKVTFLQKVSPYLHIALTLAIASFLIYKLTLIGWGKILQSLPTQPEFYALGVVFVLLPILTERLVFPMAATSNRSPVFKVFIKKHVINKAVMNYAGEGYFLKQISDTLKLSLRESAVIIKNLALARTFAANLWVLILAFAAICLGSANILNKIIEVSPALFLAVSLLTIGFCLVCLVFFKKLTQLKFNVAAKISSLYLLRSFIAACILVTQWNLILPGTALSVWVLFLFVFFISKKSPIGGDLVFVSVALALPGLEGDSAAIAAMLLTNAVLLQLLYTFGFIITSDIKAAPRARTANRLSHSL